MTPDDVVDLVVCVLGLFAMVIGVQALLREIGWWRAGRELRAVARKRQAELQSLRRGQP